MAKGKAAKSTALAPVKRRKPAPRDADFLRSAIAGQLSPQTRRAYAADIAQFLNWLTSQDLSPDQWQQQPKALDLLAQVTRADVIDFRAWLVSSEDKGYAPLTVNRKLATIRSLLAEAVAQNVLPSSPATGVRGLKVNDAYKATPALSREQARALLDNPDTTTLPGLRDRALLHLAIRTGLRCQELAALQVGNMGEEQGHHTLAVHGKGGKVRRVKVPVDVWRDLIAWVRESKRENRPEAPLFVPARKLGRGKRARWFLAEKPLTTVALWQIVKRHLHRAVGDKVARYGPHALRATFVTLALKGGAALHKVQAAAGHVDPRTTMRYARLADDLDNHAVDYVRLSDEE